MAKIGFEYSVDVESTDKQGGGGVLPHMYARIWAETIELPDGKDEGSVQSAMTFQVLEPEEFKDRKFWEYWTIRHPEEFKNKSYSFGKPRFDKFARAVQVMVTADTDTDELILKSFIAEIGIQPESPNPAGGVYKAKNQIAKFFYSDDDAKEPTPEVGIIGDGTGGVKPAAKAPVAANSNKPAVSGKPAGSTPNGVKTPWGAKKAA